MFIFRYCYTKHDYSTHWPAIVFLEFLGRDRYRRKTGLYRKVSSSFYIDNGTQVFSPTMTP